MIKIPAHYFWPGFIFGLLAVAMGSSFSILYFAQSDDGPQVVPDHYAKSVDYDDHYEARQDSIALGWQVDVELGGERGELTVVDRRGEPVDGVEGGLTFYRPSLADPVATVELIEDADRRGTYVFDDVAELPGQWDLDLELSRGDDSFVQRVRTEAPTS